MLASGITGTKPAKVALLGDSLSVGAFPSMQKALARAGVSARLFARVGAPIPWMYERVGEIASYKPDLVLVMAGTNDLVSGTPQFVSGRLDVLDADLSTKGIVTVFSTIPTQKSPPAASGPEVVAEYNRLILTRQVGDLTVDVGGVISPLELSPDGVHPLPSGYVKMGRTWSDIVLGTGEHASGPGVLGTAAAVGVLAGAIYSVSRYVRT